MTKTTCFQFGERGSRYKGGLRFSELADCGAVTGAKRFVTAATIQAARTRSMTPIRKSPIKLMPYTAIAATARPIVISGAAWLTSAQPRRKNEHTPRKIAASTNISLRRALLRIQSRRIGLQRQARQPHGNEQRRSRSSLLIPHGSPVATHPSSLVTAFLGQLGIALLQIVQAFQPGRLVESGLHAMENGQRVLGLAHAQGKTLLPNGDALADLGRADGIQRQGGRDFHVGPSLVQKLCGIRRL